MAPVTQRNDRRWEGGEYERGKGNWPSDRNRRCGDALADRVACNDGAGRTGPVNDDSMPRVSGDRISFVLITDPISIGADAGVGRAGYPHARAAVRNRYVSGGIRADEVPPR